MSELSQNVFDLSAFRNKKQEIVAAKFIKKTPVIMTKKNQELNTKIDNIKKSIQRINSLMEELKSISHNKE